MLTVNDNYSQQISSISQHLMLRDNGSLAKNCRFKFQQLSSELLQLHVINFFPPCSANNFEPYLSEVLKIRWADDLTLKRKNPLETTSYK